MHEGHLGKLLGHLEHGIHVAEAGGKDHIVPFARHIQNNPLGIGTFLNRLHIGGGNAVHGIQCQAPLVMGVRPSGIADGRYVNKTNLHLFFDRRCFKRAYFCF